MNSLFPTDPIALHLPDADIVYYPAFFDATTSESLYDELKQGIPWQQDSIKLFGKVHPQPRLTALFGNDGKPYSYSNITMQPHAWTILLQKIRYAVEAVTDTSFTSVLLNYYRDGKDSNGWHADNEKELGLHPIIASVSLGAARNFQLKHNALPLKQSLVLESGSLLVMKGTTQEFWKHQVPKSNGVGGRINLTFRVIV
jgi:alkylated DNA repair dioxygenase AlkB